MDGTQAKAEVMALYAPILKLIPGAWEILDTAAESCGLPSGKVGARWNIARIGPGVPVADQQAVIDTVIAAWTKAGFAPTVGVLPTYKDIVITEVNFRRWVRARTAPV